MPRTEHHASDKDGGPLIEKHSIRPSDRLEERRPGQGPLLHSGTSPTKRLRPRDLLSRAKNDPLAPQLGRLNVVMHRHAFRGSLNF